MAKKAEMVRRSSLVAFVKQRAEVYEMMAGLEQDPQILKGYRMLLEQLTERFDITPEEYQVRS